YKNPTPAKLGALAPLVTHAAISGDAIARNIFSRAGEALAAQAASAIKRLGIRQATVSYQGSMFLTGKLLLNPLKTALRHYVPQARLVAPSLPPIGGAYLLALQLIDERLSEAALATFSRNFQD
ncbi:MAG: BadF/BadG/BcrA/BcrD ATPase family protein, partial [Candidatus Acidiferrum sp.]